MDKIVKILIISIITIGYVFIPFGVVSYANEYERVKSIELYNDDKTEYPYEVIGAVRYDGLKSNEARLILKKRAAEMGADAIINYRNFRFESGAAAEGIAIRWKSLRTNSN